MIRVDNNRSPEKLILKKEKIMNRVAGLFYGFITYAIFFATFLYSLGFVGNIFVPKGIDSLPNVPTTQALLINLGLLTIFGIQHGVMARPVFKRWITKYIPTVMERTTYTLVSSLTLIAVMAFWEPMGGIIWNIETPLGIKLMWSGFAFGWGLVLVSTFLLSHFDLLGLRQVWLNFRNKPYTHLPFKYPCGCRDVRHPMYVGWFLALWCIPIMTLAHLVFAVANTIYILIAVKFVYSNHTLNKAEVDDHNAIYDSDHFIDPTDSSGLPSRR
jgi:protein-S-isoprenylcysteine O-methyltransferase Ste14